MYEGPQQFMWFTPRAASTSEGYQTPLSNEKEYEMITVKHKRKHKQVFRIYLSSKVMM